MNKEELNAQRERLSSTLGDIVESSKKIEREMKNVSPSRRGIAQRSLKPNSKRHEHIVNGENGFNALYTHTDGNLYEIQIYRR